MAMSKIGIARKTFCRVDIQTELYISGTNNIKKNGEITNQLIKRTKNIV